MQGVSMCTQNSASRSLLISLYSDYLGLEKRYPRPFTDLISARPSVRLEVLFQVDSQWRYLFAVENEQR